MKKILPTLIGLYAAGALISPYFFSHKAEEQVNAFFHSEAVQRLKEKGVEVSLVKYERGYFSSDAKIHVRWVYPFNNKLFYDGELDTHLTHAPLTLSGFHTIIAKTQQAQQATGLIGQHIPKDLLENTIEHGFSNTVTGSLVIHPLKETIAGQGEQLKVDSQGAVIHYEAKPNQLDSAKINMEMKGLSVQSTDDERLSISPFVLNYAMENDHIGKYELNHLEIKTQSPNSSFDWIGKDIVVTGELLRDGDHFLPIGFGIKYNQISSQTKRRGKAVGWSFHNGEAYYGFLKDHDQYALNFTFKGAPKFETNHSSPSNQEILALMPQHIDANINIQPFNQQSVKSAFAAILIASATPNPDAVPEAVASALSKAIQENALHNDVHADVNINLSSDNKPLLTIQGALQEHFKNAQDFQRLDTQGPRALPQFFNGSHIEVFMAKDYLQKTPLAFLLPMSGLPIQQLYNQNGDIESKLNITADAVTLNGKPIDLP